MKRTPLYESHVVLGGKMIEFGGWEMPVNYTNGILKEHLNTRQNCGIFDISHMAEFLVNGEKATAFLQHVMTNDLNLMAEGKGQYACICYPHSGTVDDCFYYQYNQKKYRIIANASNKEKDWQWLLKHSKEFGVTLQNVSDQRGRLSLQGPNAEKTLMKIFDKEVSNLQRFFFLEGKVSGVESFVARTGYTGEVGFEISFPITETVRMWDAILDAGREYSLMPVGLGARDTLRLEACYSLYGHELNADISPIEAGIGWAVKQKDVPFIGDKVLLAQKMNGTTRTIKPVEVTGREIIRAGYEVMLDSYKVGYVTSGTYSPSLKKGIGLAIISSDFSNPDTELEVDVRGKRVKIVVRGEPFIKYRGPSK
jgi:aminomethyltransferase